MPVQFKFRGEKAYRGLLNVTTPCTLQRVKNAIYEQARISDVTTSLSLEDSTTGTALEAKVLLVQDALVQVVVRRTPRVNTGPAAQPAALVQLDGPTDTMLTAEDLAIDRMVDQHDPTSMGMGSGGNSVIRYSRSYRLAVVGKQRQKEGYDFGSDEEDAILEAAEPPPSNYTCHRCGISGGNPESHWIWECPTNDDPDHMKKVRTAKGIPREFLRKVASIEEAQELSAGGVTFTLPGHSGHYIFAHESTYEDKKLRLGDTLQEKVVTAFSEGAKNVEESLKCPLCRHLFRQATLAPCCGATFCSDCVIDRLAKSDSVENSRCPGCKKEVLAHQLIANEDIRNQVEQIARASKARAIAEQKEKENRDRPKSFDVNAALKDRVNHPTKRAADDSASGSAAPLAITDGSQAGGLPDWQPLGFVPMLTAMQFAVWQQSVRATMPLQTKERFDDWQRRMREAVPPPPTPPTKESFQEWQRMLRDGRQLGAPEKRKKKEEKKEKKKRRKDLDAAEVAMPAIIAPFPAANF